MYAYWLGLNTFERMMKQMSSRNILIIDDDPVARMLSKRNLEIAGFNGKIIAAEDGEVGLEILINSNERDHFTIILDYHMPVMDGITFLKLMADKQLTCPVFMLSSSIMKVHREECMRMENVVDYLVKPIDQEKSKLIIETSKSVIH